MIVEVLASTLPYTGVVEGMGFTYPVDSPDDMDALGEVAGRECYQSWHRPNAATATNEGYLANIIDHGHFSVLEHSSVTFSVREVSRALTHQLVRHRHLSFSQQSERYVDESHGLFVVPPEFQRLALTMAQLPKAADLMMLDAHQHLLEVYAEIVEILHQAGVPRKRARQAARYILPQGHATRLVVTGNLRAWRDFLSKRLATADDGEPYADLEIFQLAQWVLYHLHHVADNSVQDLWSSYVAWVRKALADSTLSPLVITVGSGVPTS